MTNYAHPDDITPPAYQPYDFDWQGHSYEADDKASRFDMHGWEGDGLSSASGVSKWAADAKRARASHNEWIALSCEYKGDQRRNLVANINAGRYPAFDPKFFQAKTIDGRAFVRFARA